MNTLYIHICFLLLYCGKLKEKGGIVRTNRLAVESQAHDLPGKLSTEATAYFIFSLGLGCVAFLIIFSVLELYISLNKVK